MKQIVWLEETFFWNPCKFQDIYTHIYTCSCCRSQPNLHSSNQDILYDFSPYKTKLDF